MEDDEDSEVSSVKLEVKEESWDSTSEEVEKPFSGVGPSRLNHSSSSVSEREKNLPSSSCGRLKPYFVGMGFSPTMVEKVIEEHGEADENLLLEALVNYSKSSPIGDDLLDGSSTPDEEEDNSRMFTGDNNENEDSCAPSPDDADKKNYLLMLNFQEEEVDLAINRLGEDAPLAELVDFILEGQNVGFSDENDLSRAANDDCRETEESATEALYGTTAMTFYLLNKGFTGDEVSWAIDRYGPQVPAEKVVDSIYAKRNAHRVDKREDLSNAKQKQNRARWPDRATAKRSEPYSPSAAGTSGSCATLHDYTDRKRGRESKQETASCSSRVKQGRWAEQESVSCSSRVKDLRQVKQETAFWTESDSYDDRKYPATVASMVKEETPDQATPNPRSNDEDEPPYFFYGNVVDIPQETWLRLSEFLYLDKPEFVDTRSFSALIRKEGYLHNLPTRNRFHILPKPPMTIKDAIPQTKRWWPSWDTRKQLSCVTSATIWAGPDKQSPIEPNQVELILGYPVQHTHISGMELSDRLKALEYSFQTDTLGYHLSVLKDMFPNGLKVLSVHSGIGGAEVALHRLGIHLKCVVSVEASETNQRILKRWWDNSRQSGVLEQIRDIKVLTIKKLESYIKQFGGFDLIIGQNPGPNGTSSRNSSVEMDMNLFFEFVRVVQGARH